MSIPSTSHPEPRRIKCVVWDLDDTLWRGVLLESPKVTPRDDLFDVIRSLDGRGILHSIASRNDPAQAIDRLRSLGWDEYFLYPQIGWMPKSSSIRTIAERLNLGLDAFAFVDDQPFELAEVEYALPEVLCIPVGKVVAAVQGPDFYPPFVTAEARNRRSLYAVAARRDEAEQVFQGTSEEFLASLGMILTISQAGEDDLRRAEELTVRTHQLNSTGHPYSCEELDYLRRLPTYRVLVAALEDRFGPYGTVGLGLVECSEGVWTIKLLLTSCRVIARGVGSLFIGYILREARRAGVRLLAEFVPTGRNRIMQVTYGLSGFRLVGQDTGRTVLEHNLARVPEAPCYAEIRVHGPLA